MGPSLDLSKGILLSHSDMLFLTLNPALLLHGTRFAFVLWGLGGLLAILNTRLSIVCGLMALFFIDFDKPMRRWETAIAAGCAATWFLFEMWMMWQGFRIPGAVV